MDSRIYSILLKLLLISQIVLSQVDQNEANNNANEGALKLIGNIPRSGGDDEMNAEDLEDPENNTDYWVGVVSLVAIPGIFVALSMLLCPFWTICRCCECCCCKKKKPKEEIKKCSIYTPFFIVFACLIVIVTFAAIAYGANVDFSGALLHNEGEGEDGNLFSVAEDLTEDATTKMNQIRNITVDIKDSIITGIADVQVLLADTSILNEGSNTLIATLDSIALLWDNYNVTTDHNGETYSFSCGFCQTFSDRISNISLQIQDQTDEIFADLNNTVTSVDSALVQTENETVAQMDEFISTITDVRDDAENAETDVKDARPDVEDYDDQRKLAYNILFVIPLFPIIFVLIGGILKKSLCFTIAYVLMWLSCTMMWLLLAIHLPIAVLLNDTCNYLDIVDANVTATYDNEAGQLFQACLTNERLVDTFNLSRFLNFTNEIPFPDLGNVSDNFDFSQLTQFETDANNTDFTTFYEAGDDALESIAALCEASPTAFANNYGPGYEKYYSRANISSLTPSNYYAANEPNQPQETLQDLKDVLGAEAASIASFELAVEKIQANLSSVTVIVSQLENDTQTLVNRVENADELLEPLFLNVEDLADTARCGFIGEAYLDTKAVMCSGVLGALSRIVVSMFVIAILSLFSCCITIKLVRKVEWFQLQKKEDKEKKLQQSFQPNQPNIIVMQPPGPGNNNNIPNQGIYYNNANI